MGIRGLQTFINGRPELLRNVELKKCNIVLDGNSIFHQSYTREGLLWIFGGEYDEFHKYCIRLCQFFLVCSIKVIVVFDGAQLDDRKLETSLDRARDCIKKSSSTDLKIELSPLLLRQVFLSVLDTFKIPYVSALGEGDGECVSLANHLNAFLVAQDSDYFCYDLVRGYIPFDSVTMISNAEGSRLTARLYHINSLLSKFPGLQLSTLILACCLCGNDYLSRDLTQSILNHLAHRVYIPQEIENNGNIQIKYLYACMQWMRKFNDFQTALEQSCGLMDTTSKQVELQNKLYITVQSYLIPPATVINRLISSENFNLLAEFYFVQRAGAYSPILERNNNLLHVTSKGGHPIPQFLCDAVSNTCLSPSFIEILIHRRLICKAHIEVEHKPSIYEHAIPLLRPCLAILLKWDEEHENPLVYIHQRVKYQLKTCPYSLKGYIDDVPKLDKIKALSIDERQRFVRKCFNLPNHCLPQQWDHIDTNYHFWLMIIRYWYIERDRQPVSLYAMIVCLIKTVFLTTDYEIQSVEEQISSISSAFGNGQKCPRDFPNIRQRLKEMCDTVINTTQFDNNIVYELNCLQTIYMYSSQLNEFFNKPFPSLIHPHYFISGTLFYAFVHRYRGHNNLSDALRDLFSQKTVLLDFANNLYRCINL